MLNEGVDVNATSNSDVRYLFTTIGKSFLFQRRMDEIQLKLTQYRSILRFDSTLILLFHVCRMVILLCTKPLAAVTAT